MMKFIKIGKIIVNVEEIESISPSYPELSDPTKSQPIGIRITFRNKDFSLYVEPMDCTPEELLQSLTELLVTNE